MLRSKEKRKTFVINKPARGAQNAILDYELRGSNGERSLVAIELITGRTHQIRAQFSHRRLPLLGDRKYGAGEDDCRIALWSYSLSFLNPETGKRMNFRVKPPREYPWSDFDTSLFPR